MGKKAIVAGHICLDMTPVIENKSASRVEEFFVPGRLLKTEAADVHTGGCVANTGLGMKVLGADVKLIAKVGNDAFGEMVSNILNQYDAGEDLVVSEDKATSYSMIMAVPGIDRIILHHSGVNDHFYSKDISDKDLEETALFHFGYPPLMKSMYENDAAELKSLLKRVKEKGVVTSLDMASIEPSSEAGQLDWKRLLSEILPLTDCFLPSVEELCYILDRERFAEWEERAAGQDVTSILDVECDIAPLAKQCMDMGAKILLIKCGAKGMYYCTAEKEKIAPVCEVLGLPEEEWVAQHGFEASFVPEKILSGTGAGDTSIAAFLTAILQERTLKECVQLAAATGASCVAAYDALSGLKSFDELTEKIQAGWKKVNEI